MPTGRVPKGLPKRCRLGGGFSGGGTPQSLLTHARETCANALDLELDGQKPGALAYKCVSVRGTLEDSMVTVARCSGN